MVTRKNFDKTAITVTVIMLVLTVLFMNGKSLGLEIDVPALGYEDRLFDNSKVHTIDIIMDDWDSFIESAASEEYTPATVVIDGESFKLVGIRGKGNTSLSSVASLGSQRYSFKIEFDQYESGKTYYGLDKLALNNMIQDTTMMKDYLTYTMMNEFGVDTPLCSFVYITVNGEDWGLYLAVEGVEDSFLQRNYGTYEGELYKPDSISFGGGRGNGRDFNMSEFWKENFSSEDDDDEGSENADLSESPATMPDMGSMPPMPDMGGFSPDMGSMPSMPDMSSMPDMGSMPQMPDMGGFSQDTGSMPSMPDMGSMPQMGDMPAMPGSDSSMPDMGSMPSMPGGGMGGFGMGSSDVKLQYIDDDFDSYSNIWNNAKTDVTDGDKRRLINSLKQLSENENIEEVVNIDEVIRYFVVHNYVCNGDSYTGMMIHNYYLHEKNGMMEMIPWDYNLAFGTFQGSNGDSTVNTPIDSPISMGSSEDRPMLNWIYANEEYTEMYHQYFAEFLETVDITGIIDAAYELIAPYVEKDPTAFYTFEDFEKGVEALRQFCELRTESIQKQLENGETTQNMHYVDGSALNLSDMGSMNNGGGGDRGGNGFGGGRGGRSFGRGGEANASDTDSTEGTSVPQPDQAQNTEQTGGVNFPGGSMPGGFQPGENMPEGFHPGSSIPEGFQPEENLPEGFQPGVFQSEGSQPEENLTEDVQPEEGQTETTQTEEEQPDENQQEESASDVCVNPDCANTAETQEKPTEAGNSESRSRGEGSDRMPSGDRGMPGGFGYSSASNSKTAYIWIGISALILAAGLFIAKKFK